MKNGITAAAALLVAAGAANAQVVINEVFENVPGTGAEPSWEYIELYGTPGLDLTGYAIALFKGGSDPDGDDNPNAVPEIDEAFSLDGQSIGSNGFLILYNDRSGFSDAFFGSPAATAAVTFGDAHIPTVDTPGNLANDDSSTYLLVRNRVNHQIVAGISDYDPGYAFRKDVNPDVDFDGKIDFGIESPSAEEIDPLQIVDELAWSDNGGKEYVRSSQQEISKTNGFNPDAVSRVEYYGSNPMRGHRFNSDGFVVDSRMADEEFVYGEILDTVNVQYDSTRYGAPTDQNATGFDGACDPDEDDMCLPSGGAFLFTDIDVTGFGMTPGDFNDGGSITQFRFTTADFDFDGDADADDLALIQSRLGATLDDQVDCLDEFDNPVIDPDTNMPFQCWQWEGRGFNAVLAMRFMDTTDGPGGTNNDAVTQADINAVAALVGVPCPFDITGPAQDGIADGSVDASDLTLYLDAYIAQFGTTGGGGPNGFNADLTGPAQDGIPDGTVDASDLTFYLDGYIADFGTCP